MLKRIVLPLVILTAAIAGFILLKATQEPRPSMQRPEPSWLVNVQTAEFASLAPQVTLYGRVETPRFSTLTSALEAYVSAVHALEGDAVSQGQLLIELDASDVRLLLQQRQADVAEIQSLIATERQRVERDRRLLEHESELLRLAEKAVERARTLEQSRLASQAMLDEAIVNMQRQQLTLQQLRFDLDNHPSRLAQLQASLQRAEAARDQAQLDVQRTRIVAPFSGRVARLEVAEGDRAREGQNLIAVYDLQQLEVRAQIPGRFLSQIRERLSQQQSMPAQAMVDGKPYQLTLQRLAGEVRSDTGGIEGLFAFVTADPQIALGNFIELQLELQPLPQTIALPFSALYGLDRIYRVRDGQLQALQIQRLGELRDASGNNRILVRSEQIEAGDQIVTTQLPNAINGLQVTINAD